MNQGHEMEIGDPNPQDPTWRTGSIYPFQASTRANTKPLGQWNTFEITCVGLIGCGSVSGSYLPNLTSKNYLEVVSVCDIRPERAQKRAEQFKIPNAYPNIDAMLAGALFDLLVNTTSMPSHYPVNKKGLQARRHVWSEKPMALEVKDASELIGLAKKSGVHLWAAPTCVTSPQFKFMAETMASGERADRLCLLRRRAPARP